MITHDKEMNVDELFRQLAAELEKKFSGEKIADIATHLIRDSCDRPYSVEYVRFGVFKINGLRH